MSKNRPCPACRAIGRDSKGDHLFEMKDGTWACLKDCHPPYFERNGTIIKEGGTEKRMGKYVHRIDVKGIAQLPIIGNPDRKISKETHNVFRVRSELSEVDRSLVATYYPEFSFGKFIGYKCRDHPKKFLSVHKEDAPSTSPDFFGQNICPRSGKRLMICAGEEDTMAAYEMLKDKYPEQIPCVVGVPRGEETSGATIAERLDFLKGFESVILGFDMDEAGRKAVAKMSTVIGEGTLSITMSEKDISDMKTKGKAKEFINAFFNAKEYRPASIVEVSEILEDAIQPVKWGLSYPWVGLTKLTYGLKEEGEIIGIGASPGCGKTTVWQGIQAHLLNVHREPIAIFPIEEGDKMGLKKLIGYCMNMPIHKPDCIYDLNEARQIGESFDGLANFYGGDSEDWGEVESAIRFFASRGIKYYFIDPISALVEHLSASEANQELGKIMRSMRKMRKHQGLTFFHANHLNNPTTGKEHGEGGVVRGSQFTGSRAQWKYSTLLLGLERNQYAEDEEEKNTVTLRALKDRLGGNTGYIKLHYDTDTGTLIESDV